jgi:hypothetical protein
LKKTVFGIHKLIFIFFLLVTLWSIYSFFSWHILVLPDNLPKNIETLIKDDLAAGESVFLSSELLDKIILNYPESNIFPAGGDSLQNAVLFSEFYIISGFKSLKCADISNDYSQLEIASQNNIKFVKCEKYNSMKIDRASSIIEKFKVSVEGEEKFIPFYMGRFSTGDKNWQRINVEPAFFKGKRKMVINAHPLGNERHVFIEIPAKEKSFRKIIAGFGIADSGKIKRGAPVAISFSQNEISLEFKSVDGVWMEKELYGFSESLPIEVAVKTENAAKRHFYFDLFYYSGD